jgi:hypothetical protein
LGDPLKGNLLLFYKPLHLEAQQVSTRIEVRRHQCPAAKPSRIAPSNGSNGDDTSGSAAISEEIR